MENMKKKIKEFLLNGVGNWRVLKGNISVFS